MWGGKVHTEGRTRRDFALVACWGGLTLQPPMAVLPERISLVRNKVHCSVPTTP